MFQGIIGYDSLCAQCMELVRSNKVPSSFLVSGPVNTGKLRFVLEFARILQCKEQGAVDCQCNSCHSYRTQMFQDVKILGPRHFLTEIDFLLKLFAYKDNDKTRSALLRIFHLLLARADHIIWEHSEVWRTKLQTNSRVLFDLLVDFQPEKKLSLSYLKRLRSAAEKLQKSFPESMYTVQQIRNISSWAQVSSHSNVKILVLERAQDMSVSVENMLLKILEEGVENCIFFLTSDNPNALLPTTKSRLLHLEFPLRSSQQEMQVLEQIFTLRSEDLSKMKLPQHSVNEVLQSSAIAKDSVDLSRDARRYLEALEKGERFQKQFIHFLQQDEKSRSLTFLTCLRQELRKRLYSNSNTLASTAWKLFEEARYRINTIHVSPKHVLESMYHTLLRYYERFFKSQPTSIN